MSGNKAVVYQSGGPSRVINGSLCGAVEGLREMGHELGIDGIYGSLHGVEGILDQDFIDLTDYPLDRLAVVGMTPSSALGTTRYELFEKGNGVKEEDVEKAIGVLKAHEIGWIFTIGGGDSSETAQILSEGARNRSYLLGLVHVPKTIDNDLLRTDHCPGYGSASNFVINYLTGTYFDARSMGKTIDLNVIMGRNAGWLTSSAAWCRKRGYNPLIVTPENPMELEQFIEAVKQAYIDGGRVLQVAVSEGARDSGGEWARQLSERAGFAGREDSIGRLVLSDIPLANMLASMIKGATGARVVADTLGYGQRSFLSACSPVDMGEARQVGIEGVRYASRGTSGVMVTIERQPGEGYSVGYGTAPLSEVAVPGKKLIKTVPPEFFDTSGQPNGAFVDWLDPLVGDIQQTGRLDDAPRVPKIVLD